MYRGSEAREAALAIATRAHEGQVDKGGHPYINHPIAVAEMVTGEDAKTVALLHDVVEDTDTTLDDLREYGFSDKVVASVDAISRRDGEAEYDYLKRVAENHLACVVKIADMTHNSNLSRIPNLTSKDIEKANGYLDKIKLLKYRSGFLQPYRLDPQQSSNRRI